MRRLSRLNGSASTSLFLGAFVVAAGAYWAALTGAHERPSQVAGQNQDSAETPPIGSECTVQVVRGTAQESLSGTIRKVSPEWIVLEDKVSGEVMVGVPAKNKIPYISRQFKNTGVQARNREIWIPRDSVLYVSVEREPTAERVREDD